MNYSLLSLGEGRFEGSRPGPPPERGGAAALGRASERRSGPRCVRRLAFGLHVIEICLHVLHVNVVTYVIFLLHKGEFTCKIIYM